MKFKYNQKANAVLLVSLIISLSACKKDDFLSVPPKGVLTDATTFSTQTNTDLFVNDIYNSLPDYNNGNQVDRILDAWTDNSNSGATNHEGQAVIRSNALSANNSTNGVGGYFGWSLLYTDIRKCNVFLKDAAANASAYDATWYAQRVGEVRFLRAFFYMLLFKNYGGVPLLTAPLTNTDGSDIFNERATTDATLAFIEADCDAAANVLPLKQTTANLGRATKGAALALKGDVELFAASPLVNTSNDQAKWAKAAATYQSIIALNTYNLFTTSSATPITSTTGSGTTSTAYRDQFLAVNNWNNETIFARAYALPNKGHKREGYMGPVIVHGGAQTWGGASPTQSLIDDYQMDNGKPITDPTSGYDPAHPYLHRESRFEQSMVYDGSYWQGEVFKSRIGGSNQIDLGSTSDISNTGYCIRKTLDESILGQTSLGTAIGTSNYQFYRYAEVLLSYAEAQNEAVGPDLSVFDAVNKVRARVLLPLVPAGTSQVDMRTIIRRERRLEFCFEDKRWYDIRRWDITVNSPAVINSPEYGMKITADASGNLTYERVVVFQNRFSEYMNWLPIPQGIINQNPKLKQNPGY
ncbi:RagB/SusD family nutrient uptake outer membrane protein [Mucilaginibacter robiniae]|uniref:RagB/SusD family nutrient uptake outer membrane protein n=1 Tax=Mucilaginibacter robiniae TaxID=2728022 RepID=A0A7L5DXA1_9SPHI|nr:RagB/SusD family nutrient uptake outer membrane protein [Mucilaginibacter robiniae]QJD95732.1 RagB/SusD family nutrient uptake outer membrane protein [Mucilaginibacter robiniae]